MLTLYSYYRSSCSWRVRLALELKEIPYSIKQINLLNGDQNQDDYLKVNPSGVVPALVLEDGTAVLNQSVAILEYLEEAHPNALPLLPDDLLDRAFVRQLVQIIASDCQPIQNLHVLRRFKELSGLASDDEARSLWGRHFIEKALKAYSKTISGRKGDFSFGNQVTLADLCLIPQLYNARRFGIKIEEEFSDLVEIENNFIMKHLKAFNSAHPDNCQ